MAHSQAAAQADYARRTARAQAAGYSSLAAQRTAQAHSRGYTSRAAETISNKQSTVNAVVDHFRAEGIRMTDSAASRLAKRLSRQTYKQLNVKLDASYSQIVAHAHDGDDDGWFYH